MGKIKRPVKIITLDTETIGLDGDIRRIAIYDGFRVYYGYKFEDVEPYLETYYNAGFSVHVYIHNLEFDARKIPKIFQKGNIVWDNTVLISNKYAKIVCKKYTLHDSWRILPSSLKKLSIDFGVEHGKLDLWEEVEKIYPGRYEDEVDFLARCDLENKLYLKYLGYDVISLYEVIQKLLEVSGLTENALVRILSTASLSKYIFRNGYKGRAFRTGKNKQTDYQIFSQNTKWNSDFPLDSGDENISYKEAEKIIREAYVGGRTEVFTPYTGLPKNGFLAYHYDVNSLYPSVMIGNEFPVGKPEYYSDSKLIETIFSLWSENKEGLGFITATVFVPEQDIPPLPTRKQKLCFLTGYLEGTWTYPELYYAMENCGVKIVEYKNMVHFRKTFKVFANFVETFYNLKAEGKTNNNPSLEKFAKLILNTAYGWTVLNRDDKTELHGIDKTEKYCDRILYGSEEYGFILCRSDVDSESIQPQVGTYVTSYARLVLLDTLRKQKQKGEVYYCDTDSVVCAEKMEDNMVDRVELGKWDLEGKVYEGLFLQPKVYLEIALTEKGKFNENRKFKGITKAARDGFSTLFYNKVYEKLCSGDTEALVVETDRSTLRSMLYMQKTGQDLSKLNIQDKKMYLDRMQKRDIDYKNNTSKAWHMDSIEKFRNLKFKTIKKYAEFGSVFDPVAKERRD